MKNKKPRLNIIEPILIGLALIGMFILGICYEQDKGLRQLDEKIVIPRINYTQQAQLGLIPNKMNCTYPLTTDFYESTELIMYDSYNNTYLILANRFNGDTCPVKLTS